MKECEHNYTKDKAHSYGCDPATGGKAVHFIVLVCNKCGDIKGKKVVIDLSK